MRCHMRCQVLSNKWVCLFILFFHFLLLSSNAMAQNGQISGRVFDSQTESPLPGANVIIVGTSMGTATDINGRFIIPQVPFGEYQLKVSYIGYTAETKDITLSQVNNKIELRFELTHEVVHGEEVVITAQAGGQTKAINQEIGSKNIKNVISAERIQEIPEASAAEAVGRLPGVSLRDDKMVIRGLSPHYNQIQIDGVDMASTSDEDRSSGLGMISQYMLGGIELNKSAMADQEANVIGGTVNLIMKEAPDAPQFSILAENGYNTLSKSYTNPKFVANASRRFYHNLIGVFAQLSFEQAHEGYDRMTASYSEEIVEGEKMMTVGSMNLNDLNTFMKNRIGASLVLDYTTSSTKLKFSNFFSTRNSDNTAFNIRYSLEGNDEVHSIDANQNKITVMNNALKVEQYFGGYKLDASVSYAYSKNDYPDAIGIGIYDDGAMEQRAVWDFPPIEVPNYKSDRGFNLNGCVARDIFKTLKYNENKQYSATFNIEKNFDITNWLNFDLKMGGKFKHQSKKLDVNHYEIHWSWSEPWVTLLNALLASPDLEWLPDTIEDLKPKEQYLPSPAFAGHYIIDPDYSNNDFLIGNYSLDNMPDEDKIRQIWNFAESIDFIWKVMSQSYGSDYSGTEDYLGLYVMPQIELFQKLTLITGLRYERNQTEYTAWRIPYLGMEEITSPWLGIADMDVTRKRKNEFFLPMIHGIYRPFDWFNIKASYTHTLSRPRFGDFIPKWRIGATSMSYYNDPYLDPALSKNMDLYLSFYGNKLGLFTIGGFKKIIEDLIFSHGSIPFNQLGSADEISEMFDGLPGDKVIAKTVDWTMNNPRAASLDGFELTWQSNFWYLPGLLKGLVVNVNYTKQFSEAKYPIVNKSQEIVGYDTTIVFGQERITPITETVYTDSFYTSRLIDQANDLLNLTIGYDYKGFSIRGSMKYTDDLFSRPEYNENYREFTQERFNYDLAIRQQLPFGLNAHFNITNIGQSKYVVINKGSGWPTLERYSGIGFSFGLRYHL